MEKYVKKPAIDLTDLALGIIMLGIIVSIGATILIVQRDSRLTDLSTVQTTNETTWINSTTDNLAKTWGKSVDACYGNVSGSGTAELTAGATIPSANYTASISSMNGVITIENATLTSYGDAACDYTWYNTSRPDWALANDAAVGIAEYGNWFKIIVIVGVATLVLALIFMSFGKKDAAGEGQVGISY